MKTYFKVAYSICFALLFVALLSMDSFAANWELIYETNSNGSLTTRCAANSTYCSLAALGEAVANGAAVRVVQHYSTTQTSSFDLYQLDVSYDANGNVSNVSGNAFAPVRWSNQQYIDPLMFLKLYFLASTSQTTYHYTGATSDKRPADSTGYYALSWYVSR